MNILVLSPRECVPPFGGAKLREYYLLRALGERAELTHVHFADTPGGLTPKDLPFCRTVISVPKPRPYTLGKVARGLLGRWPLPVVNYTSTEMMRIVRDLAARNSYDLVHAESCHMGPYVDAITSVRAGAGHRVLYDWHNIESEAMRRYQSIATSAARKLYAQYTAPKMERLEHTILRTAWGHIVCSERERQKLKSIAPSARIEVVENGVDVSYLAHPDGASGAQRNRLLFIGRMDYLPNIDAITAFAQRIWPAMLTRAPELKLTIVGADPAPAVRALAELPKVEVTGTVEDVRPYYREAFAAVVPLRSGGGTRLKILEAMAAGVPVISTRLGAEGLSVDDGRNILFAEPDDVNDWLSCLAALANDNRRNAITAAALELVRAKYDWPRLGALLWNTIVEWNEVK